MSERFTFRKERKQMSQRGSSAKTMPAIAENESKKNNNKVSLEPSLARVLPRLFTGWIRRKLVYKYGVSMKAGE